VDFQLAQVNTHLDRQVYSACFKIIDKKMHAVNLDQVGERERDILRQRERERERKKMRSYICICQNNSREEAGRFFLSVFILSGPSLLCTTSFSNLCCYSSFLSS